MSTPIVRIMSAVGMTLLVSFATLAQAETDFTVSRDELVDQKAVFATVESPNVVPARARIGGTVASSVGTPRRCRHAWPGHRRRGR